MSVGLTSCAIPAVVPCCNRLAFRSDGCHGCDGCDGCDGHTCGVGKLNLTRVYIYLLYIYTCCNHEAMNSATGLHLLRQAGSVVAARLPRTWDTSQLLLQSLNKPPALVSRDQRRCSASASHSATTHHDAPSPAEEACLALYFNGTEPQQDFNAGRIAQVPGGFTVLRAAGSTYLLPHAHATHTHLHSWPDPVPRILSDLNTHAHTPLGPCWQA